jgi:tyrosyl-DNA phosphodiesterase 1
MEMSSLDRPISPPPRKRRPSTSQELESPSKKKTPKVGAATDVKEENADEIKVIRSPIRLYTIKDLPDSENVDTITIREVLSPSTLTEMWSFNFMHNMAWLRDLLGKENESRIKVRIVHGYWRQEDESQKLMEQGKWGDNVKLIAAYLPDTFGTHHSKVIVLFRKDEAAQVVVHTGIISLYLSDSRQHDPIRS